MSVLEYLIVLTVLAVFSSCWGGFFPIPIWLRYAAAFSGAYGVGLLPFLLLAGQLVHRFHLLKPFRVSDWHLYLTLAPLTVSCVAAWALSIYSSHSHVFIDDYLWVRLGYWGGSASAFCGAICGTLLGGMADEPSSPGSAAEVAASSQGGHQALSDIPAGQVEAEAQPPRDA